MILRTGCVHTERKDFEVNHPKYGSPEYVLAKKRIEKLPQAAYAAQAEASSAQSQYRCGWR